MTAVTDVHAEGPASKAARASADAGAGTCFHCGLPVVEPGRYRATVLGTVRDMCCAGCAAVAQTIVAGGFERFYETRTAPASDERAGRVAATDLPPVDLYDDPVAQRQFVARMSEARSEASLILDRIRCAACLWLNEQWLRRQPGVLRADINYTSQRALIAWDPRVTRLSALLEAVRAIGYDAYPYDPRQHDALLRRERRRAIWRLFVAGFGSMQVMMYAFPAYLDAGADTLPADVASLMRWASLLLTLPVVVFSCVPFFAGAWQSLRQWRVSLDTPIAIGIATGFGASLWATVTGVGEVYFDTISMLVFLLLGARMIEMAARQRAGQALDHLARWMPAFALRLPGPRDDAEPERVPAQSLAPGEWALVPPGERVPADGVVERGMSSVDEALLTGESMPIPKRAGDEVIAGSINLEQAIVLRVSRSGASTRVAAILRLVERASAARPRLVEAADRLALRLTAVVLLVAVSAVVYWLGEDPPRAPWVAIAVLVATCPCALALAAPIVLTRVNAALLSHGAALTRNAAIETFERATDIVFDKTGTVTTGRFRVTHWIRLAGADEARCRAIVRGLERGSRHPIAQAFGDGPAQAASAHQLVPGRGVEATIDGRAVRFGTAAFCAEIAGDLPACPFPPSGALITAVYLADAGGWLCAFLLEDVLRGDAFVLVRALAAQGLRVHLLSGDHARLAAEVARQLGVTHWVGDATPQDKYQYVARLQEAGRVVAMVGDGLNDAPVLARADVSVALGSGADAAQAQADLVLLGAGEAMRLGTIGEVVALSRTAMQRVRQNFAWAVLYNVIVLPLAAIGWIGPWEAAIGMTASSFIVVMNALRPLGAWAAARAPGATALAVR